MRVLLGVLAVLAAAPSLAASLLPPQPIPSAALGGERIIRIYLPPSYSSGADRRYPVLYVHDGQNVFSSAGPRVAFGWGNWELDLTADRLVAEKKMREIIIVAVDNSPSRYLEYRGPAKPWTESELKAAPRPPPSPGDNTRYEAYKRFLIEELKPRIDRDYRTLTNAASTGVLGSSMGGICSLALSWDRPDVFGRAGSLSGAFQVESEWFLRQILESHRGGPKLFHAYLDSGKFSMGGRDDGAITTSSVAAALRRIGWKDGTDLLHYVDGNPLSEAQLQPMRLAAEKVAEAQRSQHNELYWRLRVWRSLVFLFPPEPQ